MIPFLLLRTEDPCLLRNIRTAIDKSFERAGIKKKLSFKKYLCSSLANGGDYQLKIGRTQGALYNEVFNILKSVGRKL